MKPLKRITNFIPALIALAFASCATLSSPLAQGLFNTAAEQVTVAQLNKDPGSLPQMQQIAHDLPGAFTNGSLTSDNIGRVVGQLGKAKGLNQSAILNISSALDGAVRNYVKQNGGSVPTLQGAIVQQILTNFADGMTHGITLWQAATTGP